MLFKNDNRSHQCSVTLVIIAPVKMQHCCEMFIMFNSHLLISQCKMSAIGFRKGLKLMTCMTLKLVLFY